MTFDKVVAVILFRRQGPLFPLFRRSDHFLIRLLFVYF